MLLGLGMACNLMGTFKLLTLWFGPRRFATLTSLVFSLGTLGNLAAATPLVLLVEAMGWRNAFWCFAGVNALLAAAFFAVVRDRPPGAGGTGGAGPPQSFAETLGVLRRLLSMRDYWLISLGTFCHYGIFAAVQTLWAGPFLMHRMGLSPVTAGNLILLLNLGFIVGGPLWGALSDNWLQTRKGMVLFGIAALAVLLAVTARLPAGVPPALLAALLFGIGLSRSAGSIMYTHIKERMPLETAGTAMTGINFFTMIGAAFFLQAMGGLMEVLHPEAPMGAASFHDVLMVCAGCLALIFAAYCFTRESYPKGGC
jgi:sugar phosphate permease